MSDSARMPESLAINVSRGHSIGNRKRHAQVSSLLRPQCVPSMIRQKSWHAHKDHQSPRYLDPAWTVRRYHCGHHDGRI